MADLVAGGLGVTQEFEDQEGITLSGKVYRALDKTDAMTPEMRKVVHEIGYEPVSVMSCYGLSPNAMRAVVHACWCAPRSPHQRQGFNLPAGTPKSSPVLQHLDTLLSRAGSELSGLMLLAFLDRHNMVIVPRDPSEPMIAASMATVSEHTESMTKHEKHRRRLKAALDTSVRRLWPWIVRD